MTHNIWPSYRWHYLLEAICRDHKCYLFHYSVDSFYFLFFLSSSFAFRRVLCDIGSGNIQWDNCTITTRFVLSYSKVLLVFIRSSSLSFSPTFVCAVHVIFSSLLSSFEQCVLNAHTMNFNIRWHQSVVNYGRTK